MMTDCTLLKTSALNGTHPTAPKVFLAERVAYGLLSKSNALEFAKGVLAHLTIPGRAL